MSPWQVSLDFPASAAEPKLTNRSNPVDKRAQNNFLPLCFVLSPSQQSRLIPSPHDVCRQHKHSKCVLYQCAFPRSRDCGGGGDTYCSGWSSQRAECRCCRSSLAAGGPDGLGWAVAEVPSSEHSTSAASAPSHSPICGWVAWHGLSASVNQRQKKEQKQKQKMTILANPCPILPVGSYCRQTTFLPHQRSLRGTHYHLSFTFPQTALSVVAVARPAIPVQCIY
ncbi:hypothetical protein C8F01DRAFT_429239 [Mycena amicta]|nr:hypothetical protein C8F01DRAFT_429239 [Mycena amicta]